MAINPIIMETFFTQKHQCYYIYMYIIILAQRKSRKVTLIHPPVTMNSCKNFMEIHLIVIEMSQSQPANSVALPFLILVVLTLPKLHTEKVFKKTH